MQIQIPLKSIQMTCISDCFQLTSLTRQPKAQWFIWHWTNCYGDVCCNCTLSADTACDSLKAKFWRKC